MVADARGFGVSRKRGSLRVHRTTAADVWGYAILIALVAGAFILNHLHIGNRVYG
jgi:energy-coupling factor transporter transmembrane protein EcfT